MTYKEKKRSMFLGLPWTFTTYTVTDEFISIDSGLLNKVENDCYMKQSEQERLKRKTLNMQHLDGNPEVNRMAATDSCRS